MCEHCRQAGLLPQYEYLFHSADREMEFESGSTDLRQYILVAGANYDNMRNKLKSYCVNRMENWKLANSKKLNQRFHIFDVQGGTLERFDISFPGGSQKVDRTLVKSFTPVDASAYDLHRGDHYYGFKSGQAGIMSITDIYKAVQEIGRTNPGTLIELSFFSHGWHGGPILVNSCDRFDPGSRCFTSEKPERDPDDKDPRGRKDFLPPNMSAAELVLFKKAYHPSGFNWLWGCTFTKDYFWTIYKFVKKYGLGSIASDKDLSLVYSADEINFIINCRVNGNCQTKPYTWNTKFSDLKAYICDGLARSYASKLATASDRKTYAALLGTYSDFEDQKGSTIRYPVMMVPGFADIKGFYRKHFSIDLDPANKGFGTYLPSLSC